jgi:uncharacterized protein
VVSLTVRVIPRSSRPGIAGTRDGALLVRLTSPPVEGAANTELIEVLAKALGVPKRSVTIVSGHRSKLKRVDVSGIDRQEAERALQSVGGGPGGLPDRAR